MRPRVAPGSRAASSAREVRGGVADAQGVAADADHVEVEHGPCPWREARQGGDVMRAAQETDSSASKATKTTSRPGRRPGWSRRRGPAPAGGPSPRRCRWPRPGRHGIEVGPHDDRARLGGRSRGARYGRRRAPLLAPRPGRRATTFCAGRWVTLASTCTRAVRGPPARRWRRSCPVAPPTARVGTLERDCREPQQTRLGAVVDHHGDRPGAPGGATLSRNVTAPRAR